MNHLRQLCMLSLCSLLTFTAFLSKAADRKAIKLEQSQRLRVYMEQLFSVEQHLNTPSPNKYIAQSMASVEAAFERIAHTLDLSKKESLRNKIAQLKLLQNDQKELNQIVFDLKQESIQAFEIVTAPPLSPNLALARAQYQEYCSSCHGKTGQGNGILSERLPKKPSDFTSSDYSKINSPLRSLNMLLVGNKQSGMPVFEHQLSNQDLWSLSYYIQGLSQKPKSENAQLESTLIKNGLSYSLLSRLNDDELWAWLNKNIKNPGISSFGKRTDLIASIRLSYSFSKKVPRR